MPRRSMPSRLLARLDAAIGKCRDPVELACLRAERAGFLGRHGQVELARAQIQDIQRPFLLHPHVAVSGWVALAEGQIEHYSRLASTAHDRFNRAHALSAAAKLTSLQALSAAWLAHSEDVRHQRARMAALCAESLRLAAPDHHAARWRAALTLAGAYHFGGRFDLAQPWYADARRHAMADGDEVAVSALLYNQASLRGFEARWHAAFDAPGPDPSAGAVLGAESAGQFDAVIGLESLDWLVPMLRAQLLVLQARFSEALALFDEHGVRAEDAWRERMASSVQADRGWCLYQLGRPDEARAAADAALQNLSDPMDVDDRALARARLAQLLGALGDEADSGAQAEAARQDAQAHREAQLALVSLLDDSLGGLAPQAAG